MCKITVLENFKDGDFKQISSMFLKMGPKGNLQDLVTFKQTSSEDHGNVFIRPRYFGLSNIISKVTFTFI